MATIFGQDGTIANTGDTQPGILPLSDFSVIDPGAAFAPTQTPSGGGTTSPGPGAAGGVASFAGGGAAGSSVPISSGVVLDSGLVSVPVLASTSVTYAPHDCRNGLTYAQAPN